MNKLLSLHISWVIGLMLLIAVIGNTAASEVKNGSLNIGLFYDIKSGNHIKQPTVVRATTNAEIAVVTHPTFHTIIDDLEELVQLGKIKGYDVYTDINRTDITGAKDIDELWNNLNKYRILLIDEDCMFEWTNPGPNYNKPIPVTKIGRSFYNHKAQLKQWIYNGGRMFVTDQNDISINYDNSNSTWWTWLPDELQVESNQYPSIYPYPNIGYGHNPQNLTIVYDPGIFSYPNKIDITKVSPYECHGRFTQYPGYTPLVVDKYTGDVLEIYRTYGKGIIVLSHLEYETTDIVDPTDGRTWDSKYIENEIHFITLTVKLNVNYDPQSDTVKIEVTKAYCPIHGDLDSSNVISAVYKITDANGNYVGISGSLSYDPASGYWKATADVSSLSAGTYYVIVSFVDVGGHSGGAQAQFKKGLKKGVLGLSTPNCLKGDHVFIYATILDENNNRIPGRTDVYVKIYKPDGDITVLYLYDNKTGVDGGCDLNANDGVYSNWYKTPDENGRYRVELYVGNEKMAEKDFNVIDDPKLIVLTDIWRLYNEFLRTGTAKDEDMNRNNIIDFYELLDKLYDYANNHRGIVYSLGKEITKANGYSDNYADLDYANSFDDRKKMGELIDQFIHNVNEKTKQTSWWGLVTSYPIKYVAIIGDDAVVPFYRLVDLSDNDNNERNYWLGGVTSSDDQMHLQLQERVETPHPYPNNYEKEWVVVNESVFLKLSKYYIMGVWIHFTKLQLGKGDKIYVYYKRNQNYILYTEINKNVEKYYTSGIYISVERYINGIKIKFTSDSKENAYGFKIDMVRIDFIKNPTLIDTAQGYLMSDIPYSTRDVSLPRGSNQDGDLPVPDMAVGRVFQTHPWELIKLIDKYEKQISIKRAVIFSEAAPGINGSDTIKNDSIDISKILKKALTVDSYIYRYWGKREIQRALSDNYDLMFIDAHANHLRHGNWNGHEIIDHDVYISVSKPKIKILLNKGCHAGYSPSKVFLDGSFDKQLVLVPLKMGVPYIAQTGWGIIGEGWSSKMFRKYAEVIVSKTENTVGDIVKDAIKCYVTTEHFKSCDDDHVVYEQILYGLPTQPIVISSTSKAASLLSTNKLSPLSTAGTLTPIKYSPDNVRVKQVDNGQVIHISVDIPKFINISIGNETLFYIPGGTFDGVEGCPLMPQIVVSRLLPAGSTVENVTLVSYNSTKYPKKVELFKAVPISPITGRPVNISVNITKPYPLKIYSVKTTEWGDGVLLVLNIIPLQYDPETKEVMLYNHLEFNITYTKPKQSTSISVNYVKTDKKFYKVGENVTIKVSITVPSSMNVELGIEVRDQAGSLLYSSNELLNLPSGTTIITREIPTKTFTPGIKYVTITVTDPNLESVVYTDTEAINLAGLYLTATLSKDMYIPNEKYANLTVIVRNETGELVTGLSNYFTLAVDGITRNVKFTEISTGVYSASVDISGLNVGQHSITIFVCDSRGVEGSVTLYFGIVKLPAPSRDLDGDGLYEDINGNGRLDFADVVMLFKNLKSWKSEGYTCYYDFHRDGKLDFADVVELFRMI